MDLYSADINKEIDMGGCETEKDERLKTFSSELRRHLDLDLRPTLLSAEDYLANNTMTKGPDEFEFISYADDFVSSSCLFSTIKAAAGAARENGVCSVPAKKLQATGIGATAAKPKPIKAPTTVKAKSPSTEGALLCNVVYSGVVVAITKTNFSVVVEDSVRVVVFNLRFHPALGNTKAPCSDFVAIGDIVSLTVQPRKVSKTLPELWAAEFCWIGERPAVQPLSAGQPPTGTAPQLPKSVPHVKVPSVLSTAVPLPQWQVPQAAHSGHAQQVTNDVHEVENEATEVQQTFCKLQKERISPTAQNGGITLKAMWKAFMKFTQPTPIPLPSKEEQCKESQQTVEKPQVVKNQQAELTTQPVHNQLTAQKTNLVQNPQPVQNQQLVQKQQSVHNQQPKAQTVQKLQPLLQQTVLNQQIAQNSQVPNQQTEKIPQPVKFAQLPPKKLVTPSNVPTLYKNVVYAGVVVSVAKTAFVVVINGIRLVVFSQYFEPTYGSQAAACSEFVRHGGVVHLTVVPRQPGTHYRELWAAEFCWVPAESAANKPATNQQQKASLPLPKTPAKVPVSKATAAKATVPKAPVAKAPIAKVPVATASVENAPVTKVSAVSVPKTSTAAGKAELCPKKVIRIEEAWLGLEGGVSLSAGKLRLHGFPLGACSDLTQLLRKGDLAWVVPDTEGDLIGWLCARPPPPDDPSQGDPLVETPPSANSETALLALLTTRAVARDIIMDILNSVVRPPVVYDEWEARGNFSEDELEFLNDGEAAVEGKTARKKKKKKAKSVAATPAAAKIAAAKLAAAKPTAAKPAAAKPVAAKPTAEKSAAAKSAAAKLTAAKPAASKPIVEKPTAAKIAAAKPTAEKPGAAKAAAAKPNLVTAKQPLAKPMASNQQAKNQPAEKLATVNQTVANRPAEKLTTAYQTVENQPDTKLMAANLTVARPTLVSQHTQTDAKVCCTCAAPCPELTAHHMPLTSWQQLLFNSEWNA